MVAVDMTEYYTLIEDDEFLEAEEKRKEVVRMKLVKET